jgi:hypothetical protein
MSGLESAERKDFDEREAGVASTAKSLAQGTQRGTEEAGAGFIPAHLFS